MIHNITALIFHSPPPQNHGMPIILGAVALEDGKLWMMFLIISDPSQDMEALGFDFNLAILEGKLDEFVKLSSDPSRFSFPLLMFSGCGSSSGEDIGDDAASPERSPLSLSYSSMQSALCC